MTDGKGSFIRRALSEANGDPSFSRLFSAFVIINANIWLTFLIFKNGQFPDFGGITLFVTGIVGTIMAINKAPAVVASFTGNPTPSSTDIKG